MNDYNNIITDKEIHDLFKQRLLEQDVDDALNLKLIDMETKFAFSNDLLMMPDLQKEKEMLQKLGNKTGFGSWGKWLYTGLSVGAIMVSVFLYTNHKNTVKKLSFIPVSQNQPIKQGLLREPKTVAKTEIEPEKNPTENKIVLQPQNNLLTTDSTVDNEKPTTQTQGSSPILYFTGAYGINRSITKYVNDSNKITVDTIFRGIKRVEIDGSFCDVNVNGQNGNEVKLKGYMSFEFKGLVLRKPEYEFHYTQKDSVLTVWLENKKKSSVLIAGSATYKGYLNFDVPKQTALLVKNASGNITVDGLEREPCSINSNYGNIKADNIKSKLNIISASGDVALNNILGEVTCKASYGEVDGRKITGDVIIGSSSGNVKLADVSGSATVACNYGNADFHRIDGNLAVKVMSGNVYAEVLKANHVTINNIYGDVTISEATTSLTVTSSSGKVNLSKITGPVSVSSLYGGIHLKDITGNLYLRSSSGNIEISKLTGNMDINSNYGDIIASDCISQVFIRSASGNIRGKNIHLVKDLVMFANYGDINMNITNDVNELSFNLSSGTGDLKLDKNGIKLRGKEGKLLLQKGDILVKSVSTSGNQTFD